MNTTIRKALVFLAAAAIGAFAGSAAAQSDAATTKFLTDAIRNNIAEIKMGELGEQRGRGAGVRDFAGMLIEDHTQSLKKLNDLAKILGVIPPTEPSAQAIKHHEALSKLSGEEFDHAFANHMTMAHEQAIKDYTEQAQSAARPEVSALAKQTLPTLNKHLAAAQKLQDGHT